MMTTSGYEKTEKNTGKKETEMDKQARAESIFQEKEVKEIAEVEKSYQRLFDNLPGIVFRLFVREGNRMQFFNDMSELITGYSVPELKKGDCCYIDTLILPEDRPHVLETVRKAILHNSMYEVEYRIRHKNGEVHHLLEKGRSIIGIDGRSEYIDGVIVDQTPRKIAELAVRASEKRYRLLSESVADGVFIYQDEKIQFANAAFSSMSGFSVQELLEIYPVNLVHENYKELFRKLGDSYEKGFSNGNIESVGIRKDGGEIWVDVHYSIIEWEEKPALLCTVRDITGQKVKEMMLEKEKETLLNQNRNLRDGIKDRYKFGGIIGKSACMQELYDLIISAAASDSNVVIKGESGTGKELISRTIHDKSDRCDQAFVPVNCGAVPETLFESEFFGYKKGAFTGALMDKHGFFDLARGGTLFLDEIGELSPGMQVKLLRAIEGGGYMAVGGKELKNTDVRIIAATNRDLADMVQKRLFREDFFYRLHIIHIAVPPLRDRKEDIPLLVEEFLRKNRKSKTQKMIPAKVLAALYQHNWPGNVRELQNLLSRYLSVNRLDFLTGPQPHNDIEDEISEGEHLPEDIGLRDAMEKFEKAFILRVLKQSRWRKGMTATRLAIPERTLYRKLKRYRLN
jgi:PAS domain S-box-containing protein